jgi:hypothetical protein
MTARSALIAATAAIVLVLLAMGCGGGMLDPGPVTKANVGDTLTLSRGDGNSIAVTFVKSRLLPEKLAQDVSTTPHPAMFGIRLTLRNLGAGIYSDRVTDCASLVGHTDAYGWQSRSPYTTSSQGPHEPEQLDAIRLASGESKTGWVWFPVECRGKCTVLEYAPTGGDPVDWNLR